MFVTSIIMTCFLFTVNAQKKVFKDLNAAEFKTGVDAKNANVVILDVRTPDEISKGVIPGAVFLDYFQKDFEKQVSKLDPNKTYYVYCASGARSGETMQIMKKNGFKEAYNLKGGFGSWKKANYPSEAPKK